MSPSREAARLTSLLRRVPLLCTGCAATKMALTAEGVLAAVAHLVRLTAVEQSVSRCSVCGRTQAVVALAK